MCYFRPRSKSGRIAEKKVKIFLTGFNQVPTTLMLFVRHGIE